MARTSASNVAERRPVARKAPAKAVAGAIGAALATMILKHAEETGMAEVRERESRKQTLARLWDFPSNAEHIAFRNDLTAALKKVKKDAEAAKLSLNDYSDANPVAASIRAEVALWIKMSRAVEHGFNKTVVDLSKPWPQISAAATAHLANVVNSTGEPGTKNAGPRQRKAGRKATPVLDKVKTFVNANIMDDKTRAVKPDVKLYQVIGLMLQPATIEQCNEVIAECVRVRDLKIKVEEEMKKNAEKKSADAQKQADAALKGNAGQSGTTTAGATVKVTKASAKRTGAPTPTAEHATAYDPRTQSRLRDGTIVDVPSATMKTRTIRRSNKATAE